MECVCRYIKEMGWKQWVMLIPALAGSCCMYFAFKNGEYVQGTLAFLTVFMPIIVWISDYKESKKRQKQFVLLQEEVKGYGFELTNNPEWLWAIVDSEEHLLLGIKTDGNVEWALGIPEPIRKEFENVKKRIFGAPGFFRGSPHRPYITA